MVIPGNVSILLDFFIFMLWFIVVLKKTPSSRSTLTLRTF